MKQPHPKYPCLYRGSPYGDFCPWCYANKKGRSNYRGHRHYRSPPIPIPYYVEMNMKRASAASPTPKGKWSCPDPWIAQQFPTLAEWCCDCYWEDGKARTPCTLTLRMDDGSVNVCLNDKEGSRGAYTTAGSLEECLELVERALKDGTLAWRRWKK